MNDEVKPDLATDEEIAEWLDDTLPGRAYGGEEDARIEQLKEMNETLSGTVKHMSAEIARLKQWGRRYHAVYHMEQYPCAVHAGKPCDCGADMHNREGGIE